MTVLRADNICKSYFKRKIVENVNICVNSGEVVGLLGPNGAGKTTSFYMVVGLIKPDHGHIYLDDKDITHDPMHLRAQKGIGYLPQEASIFRKLTVNQNIMSILETRNLARNDRKNRLLELLEEFQIEHIQDNLGISLSGGERRRVEIARALAADPQFILLDEPFAGVDPISVLEIQKIITQLTEKNIGVLITDHNVRETLGICNRAYILSAGQVIAEGSPDTVLNDKLVKDVYLGQNFRL